MGNITGIKSVDNQYSNAVIFTNTENSRDNKTIYAGDVQDMAYGSINPWVPWCDNDGEFAQHHMTITAPGKVCYIYQNGPYVYSSFDGFNINQNNLGAQGYTYSIKISRNFEISLAVV